MSWYARRMHGERLWVHDVPKMARTGDVLLFSSMHAASNITKCLTASAWDHVGIVVKVYRRPSYLHTTMRS